jgi:hypothetical protein
MLGKFVAIVHRQRVDLLLEVTQRTDEYVCDMIGVFGDERET